uniref:Uncharacterized protein n=1 Tax=Anguilla anguilla TaxID=7936 RepID=A0A0E9U3K3_ANGAN
MKQLCGHTLPEDSIVSHLILGHVIWLFFCSFWVIKK